MSRRGFSLVELILAIFILGIGMISVAALFPAGIVQQQYAEDEVYGPIVAKHAISLLRSRLSQDDFGTFEEFTPVSFTGVVRDPVPLTRDSLREGPATIAGDWTWKRPGMCVADNPATVGTDEAGMYDVFSHILTAQRVGNHPTNGSKMRGPFGAASYGRQLSDLPNGVGYVSSATDGLFGIPYNRAKYDLLRDVRSPNFSWTFGGRPAGGMPPKVGDTGNPANALVEPGIFVTQRERYWPQPMDGVGRVNPPAYVWDCMFRRFGGKVQVAIFVYRVSKLNASPNAAGTPYVVTPVDAGADPDFGATLANRPAIPAWVSSRVGGPGNLRRTAGIGSGTAWGSGGLDGKPASGGTSVNAALFGPGLDDTGVPGTGPVASSDDSAALGLGYSDQWQTTGQWLVDFYANVLRVSGGRATKADGPVMLSKPVPLQPYSEALFDVDNADESSAGGVLAIPGSGGDAPNGIQDLWFVPRWDAAGNEFIPVYAVVEDL